MSFITCPLVPIYSVPYYKSVHYGVKRQILQAVKKCRGRVIIKGNNFLSLWQETGRSELATGMKIECQFSDLLPKKRRTAS